MQTLTIKYPVVAYETIQMELTDEEAKHLSTLSPIDCAMFLFNKQPTAQMMEALQSHPQIEWNSVSLYSTI